MKSFKATVIAVGLLSAMGTSIAEDKAALKKDKEALKKQTAMVLNLNGLLCAKVLDIRPLQVHQDVYEVTCIEYRGGTGTKTYIMDAAKGTAWAP